MYAFGSIDPCIGEEDTPFPFCCAHIMNQTEHRKANAYVDKQGRVILLKDLPAGAELFIDYSRDIYCKQCKNQAIMEKVYDVNFSVCSIEGCRNNVRCYVAQNGPKNAKKVPYIHSFTNV